MSLAQVLSTYLTLNLILVVSYFVLSAASWSSEKLGKRLGGRTELRLHYVILGAVFAMALVHPFLPKKPIFEPVAKVWSGQSLKTFSRDYTAPDHGGYLSFPSRSDGPVLLADQVSWVLLLLAALITLLGSARIAKDLSSLIRIRKQSYLIKRWGRVSIFLNDRISVPFSWWLPGHAVVVIPASLMARENDWRMAIAHEIQHHRQADTRWVYVIWALRIVCAPNPIIHLWNRWLSELQEFACDETLVDRNKVDSRQYARCLIQVAETALDQKYHPACATGLAFLVERNLLKRRVDQMLSQSKAVVSRSIVGCVGGLVIALMAATAFASQSMVQDRRVSLAEAKKMAEKSRSETGFPVVVNDLVLKELNRYVGTPEGREYMRKSFARMESYRTLVEDKIAEYRVPAELMAIPVVESGYRNLEPNQHQWHGAGLWMFISQTARNYGLKVDGAVDERLNEELETDAAMRYLKSNHLVFNDWLLSVLAYNIGENKVQRAIRDTGSRDAWTLIRRGYENDTAYLARVVAAILIMKNPELMAQ